PGRHSAGRLPVGCSNTARSNRRTTMRSEKEIAPMVEPVLATDAALDLIGRLSKRHGPLMFHQSGGCCDGSAPMCYPKGEFRIGGNDVRLGAIGGRGGLFEAGQFAIWRTHPRM